MHSYQNITPNDKGFSVTDFISLTFSLSRNVTTTHSRPCAAEECVDVRQRQCYMDWDEQAGQCSSAVGVPQTKYLCCCSVGRAWGAPCEPCPDKVPRLASTKHPT